MKFMLLCYDDEAAWAKAGEAELRAAMDEAVGLCHEIDAKGQYLLASPLHPVETREQLGGFYLIDVPDLQTAVDIAGRHPGAPRGTVEIRPVLELTGLPPAK